MNQSMLAWRAARGSWINPPCTYRMRKILKHWLSQQKWWSSQHLAAQSKLGVKWNFSELLNRFFLQISENAYIFPLLATTLWGVNLPCESGARDANKQTKFCMFWKIWIKGMTFAVWRIKKSGHRKLKLDKWGAIYRNRQNIKMDQGVKTSFQKRGVPKAPIIAGTRPSLINFQLLTSTG